MSESKETEGKKPLSLSRPGKLELKKTVEAGQIRQSFSHGRSKAVTVEVKKMRTFAPGASGRMAEVTDEPAPATSEATQKPSADSAHSHLTEQEKAARVKALESARLAEEAALEKAAEDEILMQERLRSEAKAAAEAEAIAEAEANTEATAKESREAPPEPAPEPEAVVAPPPDVPDERKAEKTKAAPGRGGRKEEPTEARKPGTPRGKGSRRRRSGKLTIAAALDDTERTRSLASVQRAREKQKQKQARTNEPKKKVMREVTIPETLTVQELSNRMAERASVVIKTLMKMGTIATITQSIDADTAQLVVEELGHTAKRVAESDIEIGLTGGEDAADDLRPRPPVVAVMGHVDHGKTSLLDALRATDVAAGEAGGITQHIGAYQVLLSSGDRISFIDTPGHAAFTQMRARGAEVTDIVVLVVAADDGVMPQTIEAIHHAKAADAPIIVAINKMDVPDANADKVRNELLQHELVPEEMGGDVLCVEVSAKNQVNLDKLEETILLQAEMLDLKANPDRACEGTVIEARVERGRGSVATVLVQRGTLINGDCFVTGAEWGRVRALIDDRGKSVKKALPATPVEVLGLNGTPLAGDDFLVVEDEQKAREVSKFRQRRSRQAQAIASKRGTLEEMFDLIQAGEASELSVVVKGDVQGSVEAIRGTLESLGNDKAKVSVLHSAVGGINESDVTLAQASDALIIGFNVRANPQARDMARRDGVDIRYYSVIYDVADDVKKVLSGILAPTLRESFLGNAEVREVFRVSKVGNIAGCKVTDGLVRRGARIRLLRDNVVIHDGGVLSTLKRFKDDAKEVREGYECGMSFQNYDDIKVGDIIECFEIEEVSAVL